jgi:photosystem II stability/assembly factor-like uncharacterized protein
MKKYFTATCVLLIFLGLGFAEHISAQTYDAKMFKAFTWRNIGPNRGGRSIACAGSTNRPFVYFFGACGGGLWKTTDGGINWTPVTDGQIRSSSVGAVAVSESNPDIVYIGMGEHALRGNIMQGDGVYKSTDAGKTWIHMGLDDTQVISKIRIHPENPDIVYVGALGHVAGPNDERGVFRSQDGGQTWEKVLYRSNKAGVIDLTMDPHNPNVLFAAIWECFRKSYKMSSGGVDSGLFKSTDGGDNWVEITRNPGLPSGVIGKIGVVISPADSNRVYAIVENDNGGVFRSEDLGDTWTKVNVDRRLRQRAFYYSHIYADPLDAATMYVLNTGFYKSTDGGKTYSTIRVPHGDNQDLWIAMNDPKRMINSNDGGGNVSVNGGETWTMQDYPTAQLYHINTTKDIPYHVCGAQQDNSTMAISSEPGGWGRPFPRSAVGNIGALYSVGGGESGYITQHPTDLDLFYAGSQGALLTKYNRKTGYTRDIQPYPRMFSGEPASELPERWQWTFPIVFSPHDPNVLYCCSQHVWKTTNDGQSWTRISPDLTLADPESLGETGGPITHDMNGPEIYGTVFALAPSKLEQGLIWTGSDDGLLHITRDEGQNWENITPPDLPRLIRVSIIDASTHDPATAYFCAKNYLLDDRAPYIYKTHNYGKTWVKIANGIRVDDYVHSVREDPTRPGLLYAGTEHGVWVSFDDGENWQSLSLNLPDCQVSDLVVEKDDLVAGTHGRSVYILDDIWSLRELQPEIPQKNVYLFKPRPTYRSLNQAVIDYYLDSPCEKVTLEFLDAQGQMIASFTGTPDDDKVQAPTTGRRRRPRMIPTRKEGMNRFTWDARYTGAVTFPGMIMWGGSTNGPKAVPGTYQVRLIVKGEKQTQTFQIHMDPRLTGVTQADLEDQFDFLIKVRDKVNEANNAVILIRKIKKQVNTRLEEASVAKLKNAGDALIIDLSLVEAEIYQVKNQSSQDPLNFPIKLNNKIASLTRHAGMGDSRPTDGAYEIFEDLSKELQVELDKLNKLVNDNLQKLNTILKANNLELVIKEEL